MPVNAKTILLVGCSLAAVGAALFMTPVSQDPAYHRFADQRTLLGIPHFWNVVSNLPLIVCGALGMRRTLDVGTAGYLPSLRPVYLVFFLGALLTGVGSGYYHLDPDNWTLVWDRLPMTLLFAGFFAAVWGEHRSAARARQMIWPLAALGMASVIYWIATETKGQGDLRPYGLIQFLPILLIPLILMLHPSKLTRVHYLWGVLALYLLAKAAEVSDGFLYDIFGGLSGHTLKHLIAAAGVYLFAMAGRRRTIRSRDYNA